MSDRGAERSAGDSVGLLQGHVRLAPYDPEWPELFEAEKQRIRAAVRDPNLDVQHVGSTAVAGTDAKPIIDMAIAVADPKAAEGTLRPALEALGWELRHEAVLTGNRLFFVKGQPRTHHLHVVERESDAWRDMLLFREFLVAHPEVTTQYVALKRALAERYATERELYTRSKGPFIQAAIAVARGEKSLQDLLSDIGTLGLCD